VDFPIAVVSKHAVKEKSIRHGHPSTLHLWWARRPLASCRAMLLGLLLPDPCDEHCPGEFKKRARELLPKVQGEVRLKDEDLRKSLLKFIGDFANWDLSSDRTYLEVSRGLVKAAHPEETPLVVDPFAGGGSIPLEALRLGCESFASDLNPVACLILKVLLEHIPRYGADLCDDLRVVGAEIKAAAEKELAEFYPLDPDGAHPIAYLWARTVQCEEPRCGMEIPLVRSFWLCKKRGRQYALTYSLKTLKGQKPRITFTILKPNSQSDVPPPTVKNARSICPGCGSSMGKERLRAQLRQQKGGANVLFSNGFTRIGGALMLAKVVCKIDGSYEYRLPTVADYQAMSNCMAKVTCVNDLPDEEIVQERVAKNSPFRVHLYGMTSFADLFNARQKLALRTLAELVAHMENDRVRLLMACVLGRCADYWSSCAVWAKDSEFIAHTFGRQALSIVWDYAEASPFADSSGNLEGAIDWVARVVASVPSMENPGQVDLLDASSSTLGDEAANIWFTDPPYYDAVSYADLSDFFFVWLKRALPTVSFLKDPFDPDNKLTPKAREAIQDDFKVYDGHPKDRAYYESKMAACFREGRRILREDGMGCVVFAHKTTEGWEALLSGIVSGGWVITGSWPLATERPGRLRSQESAALATSVHLVCRPRTTDKIGDWGELYTELPNRVREWIERLQSEGVRGADLVFACIGPAMEIYSRYSKVVDAEDREIPLGGDPEATEPHKRGYLAYVWEAVGRAALEQVLGTAEATARNGAAGALEEDARLTALFLWTLQSTNGEENKLKGKSKKEKGEEIEDEEPEGDEDGEEGEESKKGKGKSKKGYSLVFDVVRRFAQPLGIHLDNWEDRIIETEKGIVRLLPVGERGTQLFGQDGADLVAERLEREPVGAIQMALFPERTEAPQVKSKKAKGKKGTNKELRTNTEATTLDRVHAAMLLQATGRTNALRALLKAEQDRSPDFLRLANALSALYPRNSEEKRLLDAMLLAVPR
jgi:adenine-specific DNA methylase